MLKNNVLSYLLVLTIGICNAHNYHELYTFSDLDSFVDEDTMVICDVDNTVMIPERYEGSDMWFSYHMKKHQKTGCSREEALAIVLPEYARLQKTITVRPVEKEIPAFIKKWQDSGIVVMGLTSRGDPVIAETGNLLASISIDFSLTAPKITLLDYMIDKQHIIYNYGVLFCAVADKGEALTKFLEQTTIPKKIVFVDDTLTKIISVKKALDHLKAHGHKLEYSCFHYRHLDDHIATLPHN